MPGKRHDILILENFAKKESFHIEYGHRMLTSNLRADIDHKNKMSVLPKITELLNKAATTILGTTKIIFIKTNSADKKHL